MKNKERLLPAALLSPTVVLIAVMLIIPLGYAVYCSFWRCDYMNFTKFVGFDNYAATLGKKDILIYIVRTFGVSLLSVAIAVFLGVVFALWINLSGKRMAFILELLVLIPWVTSMVVAALLWKWILNDNLGLLEYVLDKLFGISDIGFLTDPKKAIYTLTLVMTWRVIGYVMVQTLAGLKSIPDDVKEAAMIDGANRWQNFWRITLPLVKTPLLIASIIVFLSNINNLTVPLSLTAGGPGKTTMLVAVEIYRQGFSYYHFGEATALSVILCLINVIFTVLYLKAVKYEV